MVDDITERVIDILAEKAMRDRSEISASSTLADVGIDSLALLEVVFAVEETFDIEVPYNANEPENSEFDLSTVGSVADSIRKLVEEAT